MQARFRIRTVEGEELTPMTLEIFSELVRSGVVRPDDLVFDALTGEWAPAATHPMVQLVNDPLVTHPGAEEYWERRAAELKAEEARAAQAAGGEAVVEADGRDLPPAAESVPDEATSAPAESGHAATAVTDERASPVGGEPDAGEPPADGTEPEGDLSLDLVEPLEKDPEEEARAFIAQMKEEREAEADPDSLGYETEGIDVRTGIVEGVVPAKPVTASVAREEEDEGFGPAVVPPARPPRRKTTSRWADLRQRWLLAVLLPLAVVVGTVVITNPSISLPGFGSAADEGEGGGSRAGRQVGDSEERLREVALASFLAAVDDVRSEMDVGPVPAEWLEGYYLADPEAYPEVRPYWERFMVYVDAVRADDADMYRVAYVEALDQAGVTGPVRSARIVTAREFWEARDPMREAHYARVMELGTAALSLHDLLAAVEGRISYEPARGERLSADPIIEAAGLDPEAQAQLEAALDRVLTALQAAGTDADRSQVPDWLVEGLRDAATRPVVPVPDTLP